MRIKIFGCALILLMLNTVFLYAQVEPCAGTDPDATCPLDTWVIILAAIAFVFTAAHLYRKQSAQQDSYKSL